MKTNNSPTKLFEALVMSLVVDESGTILRGMFLLIENGVATPTNTASTVTIIVDMMTQHPDEHVVAVPRHAIVHRSVDPISSTSPPSYKRY